MLKKRQVISLVSIAVISFLIGTTFNVVSMASDGGNPWNRVWEAISELQGNVDSLNASDLDLQDIVEMLEDQMLPQGFVSAPAYDSGWITIDKDQILTLTHNLDTTEVLVYIIGKADVSFELFRIHQLRYGDWWNGVNWYRLTNTTITVRRGTPADYWDYIRVMIWKIQEQPY